MIKRLYVNNFRCLVDFEISFDSMNLLLGPNGAGKSTVFDVLRRLQEFVTTGKEAYEVFRPSDLRRGKDGPLETIQTFELSVQDISDQAYTYRLDLEYSKDENRMHLKTESLTRDGHRVFEYLSKDKRGVLYDIPGSGEKLLIPRNRSGLAFLAEATENVDVVWFKEFVLEHIYIVRVNPALMKKEVQREELHPKPDMSDFAAWYLSLMQAAGGDIYKSWEALREVMPGFDAITFERSGDLKFLSLVFKETDGNGAKTLRLDELSDGQRVFLVLYTLLFCLPGNRVATLCMDEPENYLALPEIQPWLDKIYDKCEENQLQAILISHHPKIINFLSRDCGLWLDRDSSNAPTLVKRLRAGVDSDLPISQLVERGWIYDEYDK